MMVDLMVKIPLRRAWDYSSPRRGSQCLPLVYGDMTDPDGDSWQAVCVDTASHTYALAGHRLLPTEAGNSVRLFDKDGGVIDAGDYTLDPADNFQGRGVIATAVFSADPSSKEPITVSAMGKPDSGGALIENPVLVARDLLVDVCGADESRLDAASLGSARYRAEGLGLKAAGAVVSPRQATAVLTELLGSFIGSWWLGGDGRLRISLDAGTQTVNESEVAGVFRQADLKEVSVAARMDNLVNRVETLYALNRVSGEYLAGDDGLDGRDLAGIGLYGEMTRTVELAWVRSAQTAGVVGRRLVDMLGRPRRVISFNDTSFSQIHLERGDAALLSLSWLADEHGMALVNQIVRVLGVEPQLDKGCIQFTCMDTGCYLTVALAADGACRADGSEQAGGRRDRSSR